MARAAQIRWLAKVGLPRAPGQQVGVAGSVPRDTTHNLMSDSARRAARERLHPHYGERLRQLDEKRLYYNYLASTPLTFNLFGPLRFDLELATRAVRTLLPAVQRVTGIKFEHNPSRRDPTLTMDNTAFDAFLICEARVDDDGRLSNRHGSIQTGFVGVEVKYHEDLCVKPAVYRDEYERVAKAMRCFQDPTARVLRQAPLEQLWRDHLLAGAMVLAGRYSWGLYAFVYPAANYRCQAAARAYASELRDSSTFVRWTLEEFVAVIRFHASSAWVTDIEARYLEFNGADSCAISN